MRGAASAFTCGERKFPCANWCQVSLHCQLRITATIVHGIQGVLSVEQQYTVWNGVIPGPFYRGIPSHTIVYHGKLLNFFTRVTCCDYLASNISLQRSVLSYHIQR